MMAKKTSPKTTPKTAVAAPAKTRATNGRPKGRRDIATSQRAMKTKAQTLRALDLRMSGTSIPEISFVMKVVPSRIHTLLTACLDNIVNETAEQAKRLDLMRLDTVFSKVWPLAVGDTAAGIAPAAGAINSVLEIINRRSKMHGYDQAPPPGVNVDVNVNASVNVGAAREATVNGLAKLRAAADLKRAAVERIASPNVTSAVVSGSVV
jgi:hypothetical protein